MLTLKDGANIILFIQRVSIYYYLLLIVAQHLSFYKSQDGSHYPG